MAANGIAVECVAAICQGNGESLNRLVVAPHELIMADAGYRSIAGIEYVQQRGADVLVRVHPQSFGKMQGSNEGFHICSLP
jgi:single-stranded DNA-specific DHH superfamily exonuclease